MKRHQSSPRKANPKRHDTKELPVVSLAIGCIWGVFVGLGLIYSNENYEIIKATLDGAQTGAPNGPLIFVLTVLSLPLFLVVLLVGLIAFRKSQKFWYFIGGTVAGFFGANVLQSVTSGIGGA
ncbi:MAG: hypothetical protein AAGD43_27075 [Pseudomonadota bacterium]